MYIPSYQIHNVLNVYRKQLSQSPKSAKSPETAPPLPQKDRINISSDGQRQSIMDRITSEIVDRIAQFDSDAGFVSAPERDISRTGSYRYAETAHKDDEFSYTVIDEHNRKVTNKLPIQKLSPLAPLSDSAGGSQIDDTFTLDKE